SWMIAPPASAWVKRGSRSARATAARRSGPWRCASSCSVRPEQAVDILDVGVGQCSLGRLQPQPVQNGVVARTGQVAQRAEHLLLRVQHVDVDAHADLVAQLVRVERAAAGDERRLERLHLRHSIGYAQERLARGKGGGAPRALEVLLRLLTI